MESFAWFILGLITGWIFFSFFSDILARKIVEYMKQEEESEDDWWKNGKKEDEDYE